MTASKAALGATRGAAANNVPGMKPRERERHRGHDRDGEHRQAGREDRKAADADDDIAEQRDRPERDAALEQHAGDDIPGAVGQHGQRADHPGDAIDSPS